VGYPVNYYFASKYHIGLGKNPLTNGKFLKIMEEFVDEWQKSLIFK